LLTSPGGRAAVLFFILSGVSLSIISRRGSPSASSSVLVKRGAVLFLFGILMSGFWFTTILPHYGVMFMLAPLLVHRSRRFLGAVIAIALLAGPVLTLLFQHNLQSFAQAHSDKVVTSWALVTLNSLLFDLYPLVLWIGFFVLGILIGRVDLGRRAVGARLLVAGVVLTLGATVGIRSTVDIAEGGTAGAASISQSAGSAVEVDMASTGQSVGPVVIGGAATGQSAGDSTSPVLVDGSFSGSMAGWKGAEVEWTTPDWRLLLSGLPHADTTLWALQAIGVALAIIGALIVVPARVLRLMGPLRRVGTISLTAYVVHSLLVQDLWVWLEPIAPDSFAWEVGRVGVALGLILGLGWFVTSRWKQGPLEWALHQLTRPAPSPSPSSASPTADTWPVAASEASGR
jgi:uncharacterized membrane protein YeiB